MLLIEVISIKLYKYNIKIYIYINLMRNKSQKRIKEEKNCYDNEEKEVIEEKEVTDEKEVIEEKNNMNDKELDKISKGGFPEKIYNFFENIITTIFETIVILFKVSFFYILWICLHYFSAHLYIKFCVPNTILGFIMSPFMVSTPHCQGLRWIVYNAANIINNMWILIGAWIYSVIWIINKDT